MLYMLNVMYLKSAVCTCTKYCVVMVARALIIAGRQHWQQLHFVEVYVEIECFITLFLSGVFPQTKKHCTMNERQVIADEKFKDVHI